MSKIEQIAIKRSPCVVHVNRQHLAMTAKDGLPRPSYTAKYKGRTIYAHRVTFSGEMELVDPRTNPQLKCGARAWISATSGIVTFHDPCSFREARKICNT